MKALAENTGPGQHDNLKGKQTPEFSDDHSNVKLPVRVHWKVTSKCIFDCDHCITKDIRKSSFKDFDLAECKEMVDFIWSKGARIIMLTGGEPFLRNDIVPIMEYIWSKGMKVRANTSLATFIKGTGVDEEKVTNVFKYLNSVNITYDYYHEKEYLRVSGRKGNYNDYLRQVLSIVSTALPGLQVKAITTVGKLPEGRSYSDDVNKVFNELKIMGQIISDVNSGKVKPFKWELFNLKYNPATMTQEQGALRLNTNSVYKIMNNVKEYFQNLEVLVPPAQELDHGYLFVEPDGKFQTISIKDQCEENYIYLGSFRDKIFRKDIEIWEKVVRQSHRKMMFTEGNLLDAEIDLDLH